MSEWNLKRFWKAAGAVPEGAGFAIQLDGRPVRTPAKAALVVPTEALARAIAAEWDAQEGKLDPATMPCTRSANAAIDKVTAQHAEVAGLIAAYADSDLLCYRAVEPAELVARQAAAWDPHLAWAKAAHGIALDPVAGVIHKAQPQQSLARAQAITAAMGPFELAAFHDLVSLSGSFVLGLAALEPGSDPAALWEASRVDESWQEEQWGHDEEAAAMAALKRDAFLHAARLARLLAG